MKYKHRKYKVFRHRELGWEIEIPTKEEHYEGKCPDECTLKGSKVIYDRMSGPAQVATTGYKQGWERTFN